MKSTKINGLSGLTKTFIPSLGEADRRLAWRLSGTIRGGGERESLGSGRCNYDRTLHTVWGELRDVACTNPARTRRVWVHQKTWNLYRRFRKKRDNQSGQNIATKLRCGCTGRSGGYLHCRPGGVGTWRSSRKMGAWGKNRDKSRIT